MAVPPRADGPPPSRPETPGRPERASMKRFLYAIAFLVVLVFGLTFALRNPDTVNVNYYLGFHWEGPLAVLLLVTLVIGAVLGWFASLAMVVRNRRRLAGARRDAERMRQEVEQLRARPAEGAVERA